MPVDAAFVEKLAPDQSSLKSAVALLASGAFSHFASNPGKNLIWAECQGSGSAPYRLVASLDDAGHASYKCTCPSHKIPCKHVLGLFWCFADRPDAFTIRDIPDWVEDWLARRGQGRKPRRLAKASAAKALAGAGSGSADAASAADSERQRERRRAERETAILDGLEQLEIWLDDQLSRGLAAFAANAQQQCRTIAKRLTDAQATGLANRLDALPALQLRVREAERPGWLLEQFGLVALAIEAYRRKDTLPVPLAADVRSLIGWTLKREDLLSDPEATRITDCWRVIATLIETQPDGLQRSEIWFERAGTGTPRFAVLTDFIPAGRPVAFAFSPGEAFEATFVFHPSAWPHRAAIERRGDPVDTFPGAPAPVGLGPALARYREALTLQPWLRRVPLAGSGLVLGRSSRRLALIDEIAGLAFPVASSQQEALSVLVGSRDLDVCGLWDGRTFVVMRLDGPYGSWYAE